MSLDVYLHSSLEDGDEYFWRNITHNLTRMAREAGFYEQVWRPDENGIETAGQLIEPLSKGLIELCTKPEHYSQWDASNGWGLHEHLVDFVKDYLIACAKYPDAYVAVSR
jgi:hypothetical protein